MNWDYINTGFNTGKFNMQFDIKLATEFSGENPILRFYRWKPFCISLGANQDFCSINEEKAASENIEVVKRPTGGRAILHSEELTYSVIYPIGFNSSARDVYHQINLALLKGLKIYDAALTDVELETEQPNFPNFYKEEKSIICFAVSAKSEIKFRGKKLIGSAQRKLGNTILQHGSILGTEHHKKIIDYLVLPEDKNK